MKSKSAHVHALPYTLYHSVMDTVHTEKISRAIDWVFFNCLYSIVVIGTILLFASTIIQLQGLSIVALFSEAMSHVHWVSEVM